MSEKILCVDDEPNILKAYQRSLINEFHIETALGGEEGLALVTSQGPFAVVVSDMRMPGMNGVQFLVKVKEVAPDSVRVMLTGNADLYTAMEAVNKGSIFRFLTKPCSPEDLAQTLTAGVQQYRLITAERELLEKTLSGSVKLLTDILSLVNPTAFSRVARVRPLVSKIAAKLKVENAWQAEIAAMLSQVGCITVPEEILTKVYGGMTLSVDELRMIQGHPQIGHNLISHIPRLEPVAEIIAYQEKLFNGSGPPHNARRGLEIPLGARILKLALDFDKLVQTRISLSEAFEKILSREDWYDPSVVEALRQALASEIKYEIRSVKRDELALNMILAEDILSGKGVLLIAKGQEVTDSVYLRLENYLRGGAILEPIKVLVPLKVGATANANFSKSYASQNET